MLKINYADPRDPEIMTLIKQSQALMQSLYSDNENHYLSVEELCQPDVRFFGAKRYGLYVGCAALALRDGYGEMKSMFTNPDHRRQGIGKALIDALEKEARKHRLNVIRLETGASLEGAVALYKKRGFQTCGPFGNYRNASASLFMFKDFDKNYDI